MYKLHAARKDASKYGHCGTQDQVDTVEIIALHYARRTALEKYER